MDQLYHHGLLKAQQTNTLDYKYSYSIYGPMLYTVPYEMLLMRANPLRGQVGGVRPWKSRHFWPCEIAWSR
jgi:hypothetical protein